MKEGGQFIMLLLFPVPCPLFPALALFVIPSVSEESAFLGASVAATTSASA